MGTRRRAGLVGAVLVMAGLCGIGPAAAQAVAPDDAELIERWRPSAERVFVPPPAGILDPQLQQAAEELSVLARQRVSAMAPQWLAELRTRIQPAPKPDRVYELLHQRLADELARWHLQPLTPALTEAWIAGVLQPAFCNFDNGPSWYSRQALRWSMLPLDARVALLESERAALSRFGQAPPVPPRPVPGAVEAAGEALERVRRQGPRPRVPMTPMLAYRVLAPGLALADLDLVKRCALNQWWLRERLAEAPKDDAAARAAALDAFRFDWLPELEDQYGERPPKKEAEGSEAADAYPRLARRAELTGTVTVRLRLDDRWRVREAHVVERDLRVPGLSGRPVAYETALDAAALAQARNPARTVFQPGKPERLVNFVFRLN